MSAAKLEENEEPVEHVYLCTNGMVMAFDAAGQQVPAFQGRITEALPNLLALPYAEQIQWSWMNYLIEIARAEPSRFSGEEERGLLFSLDTACLIKETPS